MSKWINTLSIDGRTIPAWRKLTGLAGSPPPRQDVRERNLRHGSVDRTRFYQPRVIEITDAVLRGDPLSIWADLDTFKAKFALGTEHVLRFRRPSAFSESLLAHFHVDTPPMERMVVRVASEVKADLLYDTPGVVLWSAAFLAADPRIYVEATKAVRYDPTGSVSGLAMPLDFPLDFEEEDMAINLVENDGTFSTPPVFLIEGPGEGLSVVNESTGKAVVFDDDLALAEGDTVTVDVDARTVVLNGTNRLDLLDATESAWWELEPGANRVRLHGSGFSAGTTALTVTFRDARI